ncbi:MAG: ribonuclease E/G [Pseudomonadota bacterium]
MSRAAQILAMDGRLGPFDAAALWRNGALEDLRLARRGSGDGGPQPGEIYAARVARLLPDQGAAFLDLGGATAFLPRADGLGSGDALTVEILRPAMGRKAAQASDKPTFAERYLAHTPSAPGVNVSRKIADPERRAALAATLAPFADRGGWVIRTAAAEVDPAALVAEAERLSARAEAMASAPLEPPRRLGEAPDLAAIALRLWGVAPTDLREADPTDARMEADALADALDRLCAPTVDLPGGGRLTLGALEALVAIDVDSADGARAAANREAAREIPRQLRLRGLGGMVLVDFAGVVAGPERERLAKALGAAAGGDPLRIAGWGPLGLLELTRRQDRAPLSQFWRPS